jgi:steroid delta-isomerase-like uncharacterized protein
MPDNKTLVRSFIERLGRGDIDAAAALLKPDSFHHMSGLGQGDQAGVENWRLVVEGLKAAFPDRAFTVHGVIGERDRVAVRLTWNATHQGRYAGVDPTGRAVEVNGMTVFRIEDGKIAEQWIEQDVLALHRQIGAVPEAPTNRWPK